MPAVFTGDNTGATDVTSALQTFINNNRAVLLPAGTFRVDGSLSLPANRSIVGEGKEITVIRGGTNTNPVINYAPSSLNLSNTFQLRDFRVTRTTKGNGRGINIANYSMRAEIRNIRVDNCTIGILLGSTDYGVVDNVESNDNSEHGFYLTNTNFNSSTNPDRIGFTDFNAVQWYMSNCLAQTNGLAGFVLQGADYGNGNRPKFGIALGDWTGLRTFKNGTQGIVVLGSALVKVNGIRLRNAFIGEDKSAGLFADTYGGLHMISNCFFEIAGQAGGLNTADNIHFTANNEDVTIYNCFVNGARRDNISLNQPAGIAKIVQCCTSTNAGDNGGGSQGAGIRIPNASGAIVHGLMTKGNVLGNVITGTPTGTDSNFNI